MNWRAVVAFVLKVLLCLALLIVTLVLVAVTYVALVPGALA